MANWDEIRKEYIRLKGKVILKDFAKKHGVKYATLRSRKNREKWDDDISGVATRNATMQQSVATDKAKQKPIAEAVKHVMENPELNDKQRLFCLYYSKSFNATRSYQKAYGADYTTAMANGPRLLGNDRVKAEIMRLKEERYSKALLRPEDIFQKYMDIAFSDITDFLTFGQEEVPVMGMYGPVTVKDETGKKVTLTQTVNTVNFKESSEVDGTLISEVKQGRDGTSIKLPDRMKALQWLADHMDMATAEQRLKCEKLRAEVKAFKGDGGTNTKESIDEFIQATTMRPEEVSGLFEGEDNEEDS